MKRTQSTLELVAESIDPVITRHRNNLISFFSASNKLPTIDFISIITPFNERIDAYCDAVRQTVGEDNNQEYIKSLESFNNGDNAQRKWVFDCFEEIFTEFKPRFATSVYRGLRFNNAKETSNFSMREPDQSDTHETFLKNYEKVQGDGRHTLNSLLADYIDRVELNYLLFQTEIAGNFDVYSNKGHVSLRLDKNILDMLTISDDFDIIEKISTLENEGEIEKFLSGRRKFAFHYAISGPSGKEFKLFLKKTVCILYGTDIQELNEEDIYIEILQILQGICIFSNYFTGSIFALLTREADYDSKYSCVGEFFVLGIEDLSEIQKFLIEKFPIVDLAQRYFFKKVLHGLSSNNKEYDALAVALQNKNEANNIKERLAKKVFNFDALAGVLQLAEKIRPFSIHEGKQQDFTFVVAYPYLRKDRLEIISDIRCEPIRWNVTESEEDSSISIMQANEAFFKARAQILGNSQILQEKGTALFVNCSESVPTCDCVVMPHPHGLLRDREELTDILSDVEDSFVVKILGQKRIELFHKGEKILVWSHVNAAWEKENSWDTVSLRNVMFEKLKTTNGSIDILAKTIYQISQIQGDGASFVICDEKTEAQRDNLWPAMTISFPDLGEGELTNNKKLFNVAIEDGGTLIKLKENKFYGRRQWLPHGEKQPPFWHENFPISDDAWKEFQDSLKGWSSKDNHLTAFDLSCVKQPPKLYELCKSEFVKMRNNGSEQYTKNPLHWDGWYKKYSWGTRHLSSMGMSASLWDNAIVIVVSADNTITIFFKGIELNSSKYKKNEEDAPARK